jgi:Concanavalin A-like lectin/glucanases superfamily
MGYILRLPTAGNSSLPSLGDIGYLSAQNLLGLYLIDGGDGLSDASGNGAGFSLQSGTLLPPYASGVLQFRTANKQQLTTSISVSGPNQTIIFALRKVSNPTNGMIGFTHLGGALSGNTASPMTLLEPQNSGTGTQAQNWGQQTKRPLVTAGNDGIGVWRVWTGVRDSNEISLSLDGLSPVTIPYDTADPGVTTTSTVVIGDALASFRHLDADVGFFAVYDRAFSAAEISSAYKAIQRLMAAKGHVL